MQGWSQHTDWTAVCRRAGGRRHYNSVRLFAKMKRRATVANLLSQLGFRRGVQKQIAGLLGVSEATASRDIKSISDMGKVCTVCGAWTAKRYLGIFAEDMEEDFEL